MNEEINLELMFDPELNKFGQSLELGEPAERFLKN